MKENKITEIIKRNGQVVAFDQEKITVAIYKAAASVGGHDRKLSEGLSDEVVRFLSRCHHPHSLPTVEEIQDAVEKVLIENGHARTAKAYILYREHRSQMRQRRADRSIQDDTIPYKVLWRVLSWNVDQGVDTVEGLNRRVKDGTFPALVRDCEELYREDVSEAVEEIANVAHRTRVVVIAGPSSSGKTTTTIKLSEGLREKGLNLVALNLDNYFFDLELHPKDDYGDYDFETPEALDLPLINEHLEGLVSGEEVPVPRYNFKTGRREPEVDRLRLKPNEILLIDTLHGLYGGLTASVPDDLKFKLYIETLAQLKDTEGNFVRWTHIRLLRRMVRDRKHRSYDPERTLGHWHYVRRSEMKHIVPYMHKVDYVLNGALAYELPVHKTYLFSFFPAMIERYGKDPRKQDAAQLATKVHSLLDSVSAWEDDGVIPGNSLFREYIGGSVYTY